MFGSISSGTHEDLSVADTSFVMIWSWQVASGGLDSKMPCLKSMLQTVGDLHDCPHEDEIAFPIRPKGTVFHICIAPELVVCCY